MHLTTEERHQESLRLLSQVKDFLEAWPAHPSMRDMIERIDGHLADPTHRLVAQHSAKRTASSITASGRWRMQATLQGDLLFLQLPEPADVKACFHGLDVGMLLELKCED